MTLDNWRNSYFKLENKEKNQKKLMKMTNELYGNAMFRMPNVENMYTDFLDLDGNILGINPDDKEAINNQLISQLRDIKNTNNFLEAFDIFKDIMSNDLYHNTYKQHLKPAIQNSLMNSQKDSSRFIREITNLPFNTVNNINHLLEEMKQHKNVIERADNTVDIKRNVEYYMLHSYMKDYNQKLDDIKPVYNITRKYGITKSWDANKVNEYEDYIQKFYGNTKWGKRNYKLNRNNNNN